MGRVPGTQHLGWGQLGRREENQERGVLEAERKCFMEEGRLGCLKPLIGPLDQGNFIQTGLGGTILKGDKSLTRGGSQNEKGGTGGSEHRQLRGGFVVKGFQERGRQLEGLRGQGKSQPVRTR